MPNLDPVTLSFRSLAWCAALVVTACNPSTESRSAAGEKLGSVPSASVATAAPPPSSSLQLVALDPLTRGWQLGQRYTYRLALTTQVLYGPGASVFDFDLSANVQLLSVQSDAESTTLYLTLADVAVTNRVAESQTELDRVASELRSSAAFFRLSGGLLREARALPGQSAAASSTYRQVAAALQFARPRDAANHYLAEEVDTTGGYVAEYEAEAEPGWFRKRKQRYTNLFGASQVPSDLGLRLLPDVTSSVGRVKLAPSGRPELVDQADELLLSSPSAPVRSRVRVSLQALSTEPGVARPDLLRLLARSVRIVPEQTGRPPAAAALDAARIGELNFETALAQLEATAPSPTPDADDEMDEAAEPTDPARRAAREVEVRQRSRLFLALTGLFRQRPEDVARAVRHVRAGSPATHSLIDALGSAGTDIAQRALVDLAGAPDVEPRLRSRAVTALTRTRNPSTAAIAALKAELKTDRFNRRALYGLGTYSRRLRDDGASQQAAALGQFLVARLELTNTDAEAVTVLRALANSGYAAALPAVRRRLTDERYPVRAAAVRALQSIEDPAADRLIAARLRGDSSSEVQVSAVEAARLREPSDVLSAALLASASGADDARVRYRAVELMVKWLGQRPDFRDALERIAQLDSEERVRQLAQTAL